MQILLAVGAGSFLGGVSRYLLSQWVQQKLHAGFPFGTLAVNIAGCFLIGVVAGMSEKTAISTEWRLFLAAGFCGGFTTFSAFSNETLALLRYGQYGYAAAYVAASVLFGLAATYAGMVVFTRFLPQ